MFVSNNEYLSVKHMKIVVACDSFKGCLTSAQVNAAVREGVLSAAPGAEVVCLGVSDGGEGFLDSVPSLERRTVRVHDPLWREISAAYGVSAYDRGSAWIESAEAVGLGLVKVAERNAMAASSYGLGELILEAAREGCRSFMIGLGGTCTSDAGTGMLQALGWRFFRSDGSQIDRCCGAVLGDISTWTAEDVPSYVLGSRFVVASDVTSPLYGPDGAALMFSPQKGASPEEAHMLDEGMRRFAARVQEGDGISLQFPGAGAAGGLGAAIVSFLGGEIRSGIDIVLDFQDFDGYIKGADMVVTGEGRIDRQTFKGKVPAGVLSRVRGIPVVAICGSASDEALDESPFYRILPVSPVGEPVEISMDPGLTASRISSCIKALIEQL